MKKIVESEISRSNSKIPRISLSNSMHRPSASEVSQLLYPKNPATKLKINTSLIHSDPIRAIPLSAVTMKHSETVHSQKGPRDFQPVNETPKSAKSSLKRFDQRSKTHNFDSLHHSRSRWEEMKTPATPAEVLNSFSEVIPSWEQEEVKAYPEIYYIGKSFKPKQPEFDDENGDYKILIKDHIGFRYEIIGLIGKGSFGQVVEVYDHCSKKSVALKIIKSKARFSKQAKIEVEILECIKDYDTLKASNIIEIMDKFIFRRHMVRYS